MKYKQDSDRGIEVLNRYFCPPLINAVHIPERRDE